MNRRQVLSTVFLSPAVGTLISCAGFSSASCDSVSTELDRSACRQKQIKDTAPTYVTLGVIVGVAVGIGFALALRANPIILGLSGGVVGGVGVAAERYLTYRLEQAGYDRALAMQAVATDMKRDIDQHAVILEDQIIILKSIQDAQKEDGKRKLAERTEIMRQAHNAYKDTRMNAQWSGLLLQEYKVCQRSPELSANASALESIKMLSEQDRRMQDYSRETLAELLERNGIQ